MISSTHKEENTAVTEKSFLKELSAVLPNAKDWDGGRSSRNNKNIPRDVTERDIDERNVFEGHENI